MRGADGARAFGHGHAALTPRSSCLVSARAMLTLSPGDHIRVWRGAYHHHGIFVGQNAVVHFTDVRNSKVGASVRRCTLTAFERGGAVERVAYRQSLPARQVVRRALSQLGRRGYSVLSNNCEHFARWCKTGEHASEQVRRAGAGAVGAGTSWGTIALGVQALPMLAAPNLTGAAQTMSSLRNVGAVFGGGATTGAAALAVLPTVAATTAVRAMYADDPLLADDERAARARARRAGTIGAVAGGVVSVAALTSRTSFGASGLTSTLKLVGGGRMTAGLATLIATPAAFALLAGVVVYRLGTKRVPRPALPPPGRL